MTVVTYAVSDERAERFTVWMRDRSDPFRLSDALAQNWSRRDVYAAHQRGDVVQLSRGIYRWSDAPATGHLDLLAVSRRVPGGVICFGSALSFWELTDEIPGLVDVAVERGRRRPRIDYPPTRVHVLAPSTFTLGQIDVTLEGGESVSIYDPVRSVVDAFRFRRTLGTDVAAGALRRYLARPGASPVDLLTYARQLRAGSLLADALEILL